MGLAVSSIQLLTLTRRKADCELGISLDAMKKMQLTREMSQLTQDYNSKLSQKQAVYYANGKYNKMNYGYLMGYGRNYAPVWDGGTSKPLKDNNTMVLTDFKGQVVLNDSYAAAILTVLGSSAMDTNGCGKPFDPEKINDILHALCPTYSAQEFADGIESFTWSASKVNLLSQETTSSITIDTTSQVNEKIQQLVDFYYPIFKAAAVNGWTTQYNTDMAKNEDYVSDGITTGTLVLAEVDQNGQYDEGATLTYFATSGDIELRSDSDKREQLTQWYNAEKERISEKETWIDMDMQDLSTELEAIKTEIDSVKSYVDNAIQTVFNWGNG